MEDLPPQIESDDEKFDELMDKQDPLGIGEEEPPETIEEKYERQIMLDEVVMPMLEGLARSRYEQDDSE